jgi:hypothetical protein
MVNESPKAMRCILRALATAEREDEWISIARLAKAIEHKPHATAHTVAGMLGAFGRRVKNRYSWTEWPFEVRRDVKEGTWEYWMLPSLRRVILGCLDRAEAHQ